MFSKMIFKRGDNMLKKLIDVAMQRQPADLIFKNAAVINVFSGKTEKGDIAVSGGMIAGIGSYNNSENIIDCEGRYAMPGFIDAHVHIESTHLTPGEFAKAVVPSGTLTVIADPHEIANVCGMEGIRYIYNESKKLPLDIKVMFPSCVPATPFETSGAVLDSADMEKYLNSEMFFGVGEFMNFPGVIYNDSEVIKKAETARKYGKIIDGHASGLSGNSLNAYLCARVKTDHECTNVDEMLEKADRGMYIQIRQGSATRNLETLIKGLTPHNMRRCLMCTDDKTPEDLLNSGHIDNNIRLAVKCGVQPVDAIIMATLNAAECYGLKDKGALAPGYAADIVIADDINSLKVTEVYKGGKLVAKNKKPLFETKSEVPQSVLGTVKLGDISAEKLKLKLKPNKAKVIRLQPNNVVTDCVIREVPVKDGFFEPKGSDFLKVAVIERHKLTGNTGLAIIEGYGFSGGALAVTVAHDSHNMIVLGDNDSDMLAAAKELKKSGGGMTIIKGGKALKTLPLEIAGLISTLDAKSFCKIFSEMVNAAYSMGVKKDIEPFMSLSFLSLSVIPHLKITDLGLFDVDKFCFTDINAD